MELLNEPTLAVRSIELPFYKRAYAAVREAGMGPERVAVMINLFANSATAGLFFNLLMPPCLGYRNVIYDVHSYYAFGGFYQKARPIGVFTRCLVKGQSLAIWLGACGRPLVFGEWSLATSEAVVYPDTSEEFNDAMTHFGYAQLRNMQRYAHNSPCCGFLPPRPGLQGDYMWTFINRTLPDDAMRALKTDVGWSAAEKLALIQHGMSVIMMKGANAANMIVVDGWSFVLAYREGWVPRAA